MPLGLRAFLEFNRFLSKRLGYARKGDRSRKGVHISKNRPPHRKPHDLKAALAVRALARRLHKADFEAVRGDGTLSGHKSIVSAVHVADEEFYLHDRLAFLYLS